MDDLVTWLRAQLDDDERMAREAVTGPWHFDGNPSCVVVAADGRSLSASAWNCEPPTNAANATHIARWDPHRVLAEIDAKRRILDAIGQWTHLVGEDCWYSCPESGECCNEDDSGCTCGLNRRRDRLLYLLALPYADRPGYRDQWRPA